MTNARVCIKAPKGIEEIETHAYGLSQRERRLLIMIDGSRDCVSLVGKITGVDVMVTLEKLLDEGFITPLPSPKGASATAATPSGSNTAVATVPKVDESEKFKMAHNFMANTVNAFLGVFASALSEKLELAGNIDELRKLYQNWRDAIRLTPEGKKRADELERQLAVLLS